MPLPLAVSAGIALAPSVIGAFGQDPQERLRRELMKLFSPEMLGKFAQEHFRTITRGPGYTNARNYAVAGQSAFKNSLSRSLEARGLGTTGIASIATAAADSSLGFNLGRIDASAYDQAMSMAERTQANRAGVLTGPNGVPYGPSRGAMAFGKGIEAFMPILREYLSKRFGGGNVDVKQFAELFSKAGF